MLTFIPGSYVGRIRDLQASSLRYTNWTIWHRLPFVFSYWHIGLYCSVFNIMKRYEQGCGAGVGIVRCRRFLGGVGFLTTLGVGVGFFVLLRMSNWLIFTSHS